MGKQSVFSVCLLPRLSQCLVGSMEQSRNARARDNWESRQGDDGNELSLIIYSNIPQKVIVNDWGRGSFPAVLVSWLNYLVWSQFLYKQKQKKPRQSNLAVFSMIHWRYILTKSALGDHLLKEGRGTETVGTLVYWARSRGLHSQGRFITQFLK